MAKHQVGLLAIGLMVVGFVLMYRGVQVDSGLQSTMGLIVTIGGSLAVIRRF
ncbi:MAG: hypothetical protein R6U70_06850 [Bacillota bacterium]